jgi:hypothetical protein
MIHATNVHIGIANPKLHGTPQYFTVLCETRMIMRYVSYESIVKPGMPQKKFQLMLNRGDICDTCVFKLVRKIVAERKSNEGNVRVPRERRKRLR